MAKRITPEQITQVSGLGSGYITFQRTKYARPAAPMSAQERAAMEGFLSSSFWTAPVRSCCEGAGRQSRFLSNAERFGVQEPTGVAADEQP